MKKEIYTCRFKDRKRAYIIFKSAGDTLGRFRFSLHWYDKHHPYCLTCGKVPEANCSCWNKTHIRGQNFFAVPKEFITFRA